MKVNMVVRSCAWLTAFTALLFLGTLAGFVWTRTTARHDMARKGPSMTVEYYDFLRGQILSKSGFDLALSIALDDSRSHEWKALQWMFAHDREVDNVDVSPILQRFAMVAAFLSLDVDVSTDHECDWEPVQCNDQGQIISLNSFQPLSLSGGTIPRVLMFLSSLEVLDLADQGIKGVLPSPHGWANLRELRLGGNRLTSVFDVLAKNTAWPIRIEFIDLRGNDLAETISGATAPIASWTKLRHLNLVGNGRLASSTLLDDLHWATVEYLNIAETNISGSLAMNADYSQLQVLNAGFAPLTGLLPERLGDASDLQFLSLGLSPASQITGTLPDSFGRLTQLQQLSIVSSGINGTLPSSWGGLTKLHALDLYDNPRLHGTIPDSWQSLTSLQVVRLVDTGLSGTVPSTLSRWTNLQSFSVHRTSFNGTIPTGLCELPNLTTMTANCGDDDPDINCGCCSFCFRRENSL